MRCIFLGILFAFLFVPVHAQQNEGQAVIDSLQRLLQKTNKDSQRIRVVGDLSYAMSDIDPDKGIEYARQHLELAQKLHWQGEKAYAYSNLGTNYTAKGDFVQALNNDLEALKIYEEMKSKSNVASVLGNIGIIYEDLKNLPKALYYDSVAMKMQRELHDKSGESINMINLAGVFGKLGDTARSMELYTGALAICESMHDLGTMAVCLSNIGGIYQQQGDIINSLNYQTKALALNRETGNKRDEAINLGSIGNDYLAVAKNQDLIKAPDSLIGAGKTKNLQRAYAYMLQASQLAEEVGDLNFFANCLKFLSEISALMGNYKEALEYKDKYVIYKDSVSSDDVRLKIAGLETKREADLKEKQIEINKLGVTQKRNERIIFIAGIGVLLLVTTGVYSRFRNQKKISDIRQAALKQKEMLMKEIHHRVKNNLQVISSLLNMQVVNMNDPQVKEAMTESTSRLKAILLLHQQLYRNDQVANIECSGFITDLFNQVSTVFKRPGQDVKLINNIELTTLDIDTGMSLGLIINELTTNSYKYAFDEGNGSVTVDIKRNSNGEYQLFYKDSGPGLPEGLDVRSLKSLGMKIMNSLSRQTGGSMQYDRETNNFIITFKDVDGRKKRA